MASQPFFSVVIPTKNRPGLLQDAIKSVLYQAFVDYELIVSDNWNDARTGRILKHYSAHPRVRVVRPSRELNMPDHWEFATRTARGRYVLVLTDRSVLRQGALAYIHGALEKMPDSDVVSWSFSGFEEEEERTGRIASFALEETEPRQMRCDDLLAKAAEEGFDFRLLPRGLNSCYRDALGAKIREKHGALFLPVSPDMTSAFLNLSYGKHLLHLPRTMLFFRGASLSNGGRSFRDPAPYLKTLPERDWYERLPIKAPLMENFHYSDFLAVQSHVGGDIKRIPVNWTMYFLGCYKEILKRKSSKIFSKETISELKAAWQRGLQASDAKTQKNVAAMLPGACRAALLALLKERVRNSIAWPLVRALRAHVVPRYAQGAYKTALEAAGFRLA